MKVLTRLLAIAALVLAPVAAAYADECTNLYLHTKAGEKIGFRFADKPNITFNRANALIIKSDVTEVMVKGFSTVDKITFDDAAGITDVEADAQGAICPGANNLVTLSGFAEGTNVTVSNLNGQVLQTVSTVADGVTEVSLDAYGKGVYINADDDVVCKFANK